MKNRKPETPRPKADAREAAFKAVMDEADAREARIQSKTIGDLAGMLRQIVAARGKGENRPACADHPLRPAILDAFHLARELERTTIGPDPATGLKANALNRLAVLLMNVLKRMKRGEADAGENVDLLAAAAALAGGKAQEGAAAKAEKPTAKPTRPPRSGAE